MVVMPSTRARCKKVRAAMAARGGRADESLLSRLGLCCLSNSADRLSCNMATVLDGPQMFPVPLHDIEVGEELTHFYNVDSLLAAARPPRVV